MMKNDLPVACTLGPDALQARREQLLPGLIARAVERIEVPEGLRLRFNDADTLGAIAHVIEVERRCCRFLRFALTAEPGDGPIWVEVTGPAGTRAFLDAL